MFLDKYLNEKHLEMFEYDEDGVERNILKLKDKLGDNFVWKVGNNLSYLEDLLG